MASVVDKHTHAHILWRNESDFKKPGARRPPGLTNLNACALLHMCSLVMSLFSHDYIKMEIN